MHHGLAGDGLFKDEAVKISSWCVQYFLSGDLAVFARYPDTYYGESELESIVWQWSGLRISRNASDFAGKTELAFHFLDSSLLLIFRSICSHILNSCLQNAFQHVLFEECVHVNHVFPILEAVEHIAPQSVSRGVSPDFLDSHPDASIHGVPLHPFYRMINGGNDIPVSIRFLV